MIELKDGLRQPGDYSYERGYKATKRFLALPDPPMEVFCVNDPMAFGALDEARAVGGRVPDDVWVRGLRRHRNGMLGGFRPSPCVSPSSGWCRARWTSWQDGSATPTAPPSTGGSESARGSTAYKKA